MIVQQIKTGGDRNFAYVAADEASREAFIVDPSYDPKAVHQFVREQDLKLRYIFNTHRHHDHTNGNEKIRSITNVRPIAFGDLEPRSGRKLEDGTVLRLGSREVKMLHTPGHTDDSMCILFGGALFTGDTLFVGKVGGTDYDEGAKQQYHSLHEKIKTLPDDTVIYPGHDVGTQPTSTVGREKKTNPFLQQPDLESFIALKRNWLEYKKEHGIE